VTTIPESRGTLQKAEVPSAADAENVFGRSDDADGRQTLKTRGVSLFPSLFTI
jgi:hypothetical protein